MMTKSGRYTKGYAAAITAASATIGPIIPPSRGHGFDVYTELGTDKVLIYARFDSSTKDFPVDTQFAQVGILKNPQELSSTSVFTQSHFSSLFAVKLADDFTGTPTIGGEITQTRTDGNIAKGYVASYDSETKVLKYFQDRSLYFGNEKDQTDYDTVDSQGKVLAFESTATAVTATGFSASIETTFSSGITTVGTKNVDLGVSFTAGMAVPEINKGSGEVIYLDNRASIARNARQKEDLKIILEF